jgi:hypothetical protein
MSLRNIGIRLQDCTMSHPRRPQSPHLATAIVSRLRPYALMSTVS